MEGKRIQKMRLKKGSFTKYCGGDVTDACIKKGENSPNEKTQKRANLARVFRKMKK